MVCKEKLQHSSSQAMTLSLLLVLLVSTAYARMSFYAGERLALLKPGGYYASSLLQQSALRRREDCPPCFNCALPAFECRNFASCNNYTGKCDCASGFGGEDCSKPVCGALPDGQNRPIRTEPSCTCRDGWTGINCNVCTRDDVCDSLVPTGMNGTCYSHHMAVEKNYQQCNVTNPKIIKTLGKDIPQVTFTCNKTESVCRFQFWAGERESFYCGLESCAFKQDNQYERNITTYECKNMQCRCMPNEILCGKDGSVDITEFLTQEIKGPGTFDCISGKGCQFREPAMNDLISEIFGDTSISLSCRSGECLHYTQLPEFERSPKPDNGLIIVIASVTVIALLLMGVGGIYFASNRSNTIKGYTPLDQGELNQLMSNHVPASLMFRNIQYSINGKSILKGVQGIVKPGEVMAIMGASGAGKSTFLDILARRPKTGAVSGDIFVNGKSISGYRYKRIIGYVDQEDTLMGTLTVEETIMYSALLRLPRSMPLDSKRARVKETMTELGILEIAQSRIGSSEKRGISGGEKRRVSIACELVTSPSILFLDEPTSGLDAYNAYNVIECLVNMASNFNRTIIFTIHQPRSNIYALFDHLVLLAKGELVYSGSAQTAVNHFSKLRFDCPVGFNIADYLVDLSVYVDRSQSVDDEKDVASTNNATESSPSFSVSLQPNSPRKTLTSARSIQEHKLFSTRLHQSPTTGSIASSISENIIPRTGRQPQQQHKALIGDPESDREENVYWEDDVKLLNEKNPKRGAALHGVIGNSSALQSQDNLAHLSTLVNGYASSITCLVIKEEINSICATSESRQLNDDAEGLTAQIDNSSHRASWLTQFRILSDRTFKNLYRNPYLLLTHYLISIIVALMCGFLFWDVTNDIPGFQNRMGCLFFVCALFGFGCLSSLQVFASERILFVRERANQYYAPFTYFLSKVIFDIVPLRMVPPLLLGAIIYPMVGLVNVGTVFLKFMLALVLFNLTSASVCFQIGIAFPDLSIANLLSSLVMLFSMLFGGLLLNKDTIPLSLRWLKHLSFFNFALEAMVTNELKDLQLTEKKYGLEIDVPAAVILSTFGFDAQAYWSDIFKLLVMFLGCLTGSFICLQFFVKERR